MFPRVYTDIQQTAIIDQGIEFGNLQGTGLDATQRALIAEHTDLDYDDMVKRAYDHAREAQRLLTARNAFQKLYLSESDDQDVLVAKVIWFRDHMVIGARLARIRGDEELARRLDRFTDTESITQSNRSAWQVIDELMKEVEVFGVQPTQLGLRPKVFEMGKQLAARFDRERKEQDVAWGVRVDHTTALHKALSACYQALLELEVAADLVANDEGEPPPGMGFGRLRAAFHRRRPTDAEEVTPPATPPVVPPSIPTPTPAPVDLSGLPPLTPKPSGG